MHSNISSMNNGITLETIFSEDNIQEAIKTVVRNNGVAGVDKMTAKELLTTEGKEVLNNRIARVFNGKYKSLPVKRVYIPKENGDRRPLGIPTVTDRVLQQAVSNKLSELYEPIFSNSSYGFRPERSPHDALDKALEHVKNGYLYVIDMDLEKFFDTVNHSKLLQLLNERIKDPRVISLIHKFLRGKIQEGKEKAQATTIGTPQGGPISPMLANILLHELDMELEKRGHKFVRYADDMLIFCKSKQAAVRAYKSITLFIERKLFLKINKEKTKIGLVDENYKFLGYAIKARQFKNGNIRAKLVIHDKSKAKVAKKLTELLDRRAKGGFIKTRDRYKSSISGWFHYYYKAFQHSEGLNYLKKLDSRARHRIRVMYWKQWKTPNNRKKKLSQFENGHIITFYSTRRYNRIVKVLRRVLTKSILEHQHRWVMLTTLKDLKMSRQEHLANMPNTNLSEVQLDKYGRYEIFGESY